MGVTIREEVVLPRRVVPQPDPAFVKGGDCGACVLAGLLDISVQRVYDEIYGGHRDALSRPEYEQVLRRIEYGGWLDRTITDVPIWVQRRMNLPFGNVGHLSFPEWFSYVRMAVDAGYYGIASVVYGRTGVGTQVPPATDHVVLICGVRTVDVPLERMPGTTRLDQEVLVSCSAKATPPEEWVEVKEFLATRGGYNVMLVRPCRRGDA